MNIKIKHHTGPKNGGPNEKTPSASPGASIRHRSYQSHKSPRGSQSTSEALHYQLALPPCGLTRSLNGPMTRHSCSSRGNSALSSQPHSARSSLPRQPDPSLSVLSHRFKPLALSTLNRAFRRKKLRGATQPFRRPGGRTAVAQLALSDKPSQSVASEVIPIILIPLLQPPVTTDMRRWIPPPVASEVTPIIIATLSPLPVKPLTKEAVRPDARLTVHPQYSQAVDGSDGCSAGCSVATIPVRFLLPTEAASALTAIKPSDDAIKTNQGQSSLTKANQGLPEKRDSRLDIKPSRRSADWQSAVSQVGNLHPLLSFNHMTGTKWNDFVPKRNDLSFHPGLLFDKIFWLPAARVAKRSSYMGRLTRGGLGKPTHRGGRIPSAG